MLRPRIIPCLLVHDKGLVKTVNFKNPKYVGDPINAVRIFNEKEVDELMVLDIDATSNNQEPDYRMIEHLAAECRMPLGYGGGVRTAEQAKRILSLGVEKISISAAAVSNPHVITEMAEQVGNQSVVVVLDVKKKFLSSKYEVWTHNGKRNSGKDAVKFAEELEKFGVGEIVVNSIDNDGVMKGYDLNLAEKIRQVTTVPITILGGAGSLQHIGELINRHHIIGAAAGSLFVFKGVYKAVLINYPGHSEKEAIFRTSLNPAQL
jgi:imidazole glycerol-phosphate synthase subunit HisF